MVAVNLSMVAAASPEMVAVMPEETPVISLKRRNSPPTKKMAAEPNLNVMIILRL
jgi:hypothetical protein